LSEKAQSFLKEVEVADHCFLSEAVEWISLGRVPEANIILEDKTYDPVESRFYWRDMPDNFEPVEYYPWYDRREFQSLGIPIREDYFQAAEICTTEGVFDLPDRIRQYQERGPLLIENDDGEPFDLTEKMISDMSESVARYGKEREIVQEVEAEFGRFLDLGWALVFQWIQREQINLEGIDLGRWEKLADEGKYQEAARFDVVPPSQVGLSTNWKANELATPAKQFVSLRVQSSILANLLDDARLAWSVETVQRFGGFYRLQDPALSPPSRRRSRSVRWDRIKSHLLRLELEGRCPQNKESCIFELIAFSEAELAVKISRTSVQRHLGKELRRIYE
jgi:hypothetical protein